MITSIEIVMQVIADAVDLPVFSKVPQKRPDAFIRVDQGTPGTLSPVHDEVPVIVQVYSLDLEEAIETAFVVRELLSVIEGLHPSAFGATDIRGPYEFPDPDLQSVHRWQVTGSLFFAPA